MDEDLGYSDAEDTDSTGDNTQNPDAGILDGEGGVKSEIESDEEMPSKFHNYTYKTYLTTQLQQ